MQVNFFDVDEAQSDNNNSEVSFSRDDWDLVQVLEELQNRLN